MIEPCKCICHAGGLASYKHPDYPCCPCSQAQQDEGKIMVDKHWSVRDKIVALEKLYHSLWSRITDLEGENRKLKQYISDCDKARFDADQSLSDRIGNITGTNTILRIN